MCLSCICCHLIISLTLSLYLLSSFLLLHLKMSSWSAVELNLQLACEQVILFLLTVLQSWTSAEKFLSWKTVNNACFWLIIWFFFSFFSDYYFFSDYFLFCILIHSCCLWQCACMFCKSWWMWSHCELFCLSAVHFNLSCQTVKCDTDSDFDFEYMTFFLSMFEFLAALFE